MATEVFGQKIVMGGLIIEQRLLPIMILTVNLFGNQLVATIEMML